MGLSKNQENKLIYLCLYFTKKKCVLMKMELFLLNQFGTILYKRRKKKRKETFRIQIILFYSVVNK